MKKTVIPLLLSLVAGAATPAFAQDPAPGPSADALGRVDDLEAEIDDFVMAWREEQSALYEEYQAKVKAAEAAGEAAPAMPAMRMRPDFEPFVASLMGWADEADAEDAALYYTKVVDLDGMGADSVGRDAFDRLVNDHPESPSWARLGGKLTNLGRMLGDEEYAGEVMAILRESPHGNVRGWVALVDNTGMIENAELSSDSYATAKRALLAAMKQADDKALRNEIEAVIELREKFGVGATAPDIVGTDLDGVEFKLSDYKGKIVFLDFWGDW